MNNKCLKKRIHAASSGSNDDEDKSIMDTNVAASTERYREDDTSTTSKQDANHVLEREAGKTIEKKRLRERKRRHEISQAVDYLFEAMVQIDPPQVIVSRRSLNRTDMITSARDMLFRQDDRIKELEDELKRVKVASSASVEPVVKDISATNEDFFRNPKDKNINKAVGNVHNINDATTPGKCHDITNTPLPPLLPQEAKQRQKLQQQVSSSSSFVAPGRYSTDASTCPSTAPTALLLMQQQEAAAASRTNSSQQQQQRDDPRYFHGGLNPNNMHNLLERTRQQQQYSRRHQFSPYQHTSTATSSSGYNTQEGSLFARAVPIGIGRSMYASAAGLNVAAADPAPINPSSRPYAAENYEQLSAISRSSQHQQWQRQLQRQQQGQQQGHQQRQQPDLIRSILGFVPDCQLTTSDVAAFFSGNNNDV